MSDHPESLVMWEQRVIGEEICCAHCREPKPCTEYVARHNASDWHRNDCRPSGRCIVTRQPVAFGGEISRGPRDGVPARIVRVRNGMTVVKTLDGQDAIVPAPSAVATKLSRTDEQEPSGTRTRPNSSSANGGDQ